MKITTRDHVSDRTADGRVYSAGAGAVSLVDDADTDMVAMMRSLADRGLVDIEEDDASDAAAQSDAGQAPADPEMVSKIEKPAARKSAAAKMADDEKAG